MALKYAPQTTCSFFCFVVCNLFEMIQLMEESNEIVVNKGNSYLLMLTLDAHETTQNMLFE